MRHPTEGVIRRLLDEPAGVTDSDRQHVGSCAHCLSELAATREDAVLVGAALTVEVDGEVDITAAWQRFSTAARTAPTPAGPVTQPRRALAPARTSRLRATLRRPAVAVLAFGLVLTGAGTAAANDWLQIFRTEQIAPVSFSAADLVALPDLSAYGDVVLTGDGDMHAVDDVASAEAESGLDVPTVTVLPRGVSGEPFLQVAGEVSATFTFSAERAAESAAAAGGTLPPLPAGLDGSQVRLVAGPGVGQLWTSAAGAPGLVVGRAVAPTAFSSGVPFETVRDYVLSLTGLPDEIAAQLRTFTADGSTLPLPVPADEVTTSTADVNGVAATVLATRDRTMAAVVWVEDGVVTAVAGTPDAGELLDVARNLG